MVADAAAYAVLGLEPGADWAAVERAYRELIKLHHPDRSGGDAQRAAEIIHAYRELKRARDAKGALILLDEAPAGGRRYDGLWAALAVAAVGALVFALGPLKPSHADRPVAAAREPAADPMDSDPSAAVVDAAVRDAARIFRAKDELALASASRDCHNRLRAEPSFAQLDRCAAFDDAVVMLQDRDPLRSQGPYSELAVTSRQFSAGAMLSNDSLAVDSRLDRIRLQVELALAGPPPQPPSVPEMPGSESD
jgi:hypothetical protein